MKSISPEGWLAGARRVDSPNFDARPEGVAPSIVVIHAISLPAREFGGSAVEALFTNGLEADAHPIFATVAQLRVSSHFFIRRDGACEQYVSCTARAWHAGVSSWRTREYCNDFAIGIELEGCDELPFEAAQYRALRALLGALRSAYPTLTEAVGHSEIAPGRKTDPGPYFDWHEIDARWRVDIKNSA